MCVSSLSLLRPDHSTASLKSLTASSAGLTPISTQLNPSQYLAGTPLAPAVSHVPQPSLLPVCFLAEPRGCQAAFHSPTTLQQGCVTSEPALTYCPTSWGVRRRRAGDAAPRPRLGAAGPICSTQLLPGALAAPGDGAWGGAGFLGQSQRGGCKRGCAG